MSNKDMKVDFLGIGTQRSGSTWVHAILHAHPEVCVSNPKETGFFHKTHEDMSVYSAYFTHCSPSQKKGEVHPGYMYRKATLERIKEQCPDAQLIVVLRNPIERALSHFQFHKKRGAHKVRDVEELASTPNNPYIRKSQYAKHIKNLYDIFPSDQILILLFEEIGNAPLQTAQRIYAHIGVLPEISFSVEKGKVNSTESVNTRVPYINTWINTLRRHMYKMPKAHLVTSFFNRLGVSALMRKIQRYNTIKKSGGDTNGTGKEQIPEELLESMYEHFESDIDELESLLRQDLSHWRIHI